MKKLLSFVLATFMLLSVTACGGEKDTEQPADTQAPVHTDNSAGSGPILPLSAVTLPDSIAFDDYDAQFAVRDANPVNENFLNALNAFAYQSAVNILNNGKSENACFSPLSLYYALAIAATGAAGETQRQMLEALGVDDAAALSQQSGNLFRFLYTENEVRKLNIANSLWIDDELSPKNAFVENVVENFYAETYRVDFASQAAADAMAEWIEAHTNGKLSPSFEPDERQILSIINTIYYLNQWVNQFDPEKTAKDTFTLKTGETVECDFINSNYSQGYYKGSNFTLSSVYLKDNDRMVFVLPDEDVSVYDLVKDADTLAAILSSPEETYGEFTFKLPKFDQSADMDLVEALKALGITEAFEEHADFTGITDEGCFISGVNQQCRVALDENGVEATAFTQITMCGTGMPMGSAELILDRPFLYAIVSSNGTVMFLGICMNPAA